MTAPPNVNGAHGFAGHEVADFTSRRTLVLRRFGRNRFAVASLALLVLLFVGCYALPAVLPYS
jgi:peptide/nickel transport system permease protein